MSASFLSVALIAKGNLATPKFEDGLAAAERLGWTDVRMADFEEEHDYTPAGFVALLQENLEELSSVVTPDDQWTIYFTGGMSWGDAPSDAFTALDGLFEVPEVLRALGFNVGAE